MAIRFPIQPDEKYGGTVSFTAIRSSTNTSRNSAVLGQSRSLAAETGGNFNLSASQQQVGTTRSSVTSVVGDVVLYLPPGIQFSDGVGYDNTNLGFFGNMVANAAGAGMSGGASGAGQFAKQSLDQFVSSFDKMKSSAFGPDQKNAMAAVAERMAPEGLSQAIQAGTGITANPHTRSIFRDVALRQFSFNFSLLPMSPEEAEAAEQIVQFFRENLYPEKVNNGYSYKFPTKFRIKFKYKDNDIAHKLLPCYLTSVQTNYNSNSGTFHTDGKFSQTDIAVSFQEEKTLTKEDIQAGF